LFTEQNGKKQPAEPATKKTEPNARRGKKKRKDPAVMWMLVISGVLLVVAGIVVLAVVLSDDDKKKPSARNPARDNVVPAKAVDKKPTPAAANDQRERPAASAGTRAKPAASAKKEKAGDMKSKDDDREGPLPIPGLDAPSKKPAKP
jgi:hypothetical protein